MQTDDQLIRRIKRKKDREAADELLQRYYREIYAYTYRQTGNRELAMDLTQDIFVAVLKGIGSFHEKKASFRTWLYRVASNKITDHYRSRSWRMSCVQSGIDPDDLEMPVDDAGIERIFQRDLIQQIMGIVSRFDLQRVEIFQKKCFEEMTFCAIAEEMGIPESTVKSRFYSVIRAIKKEVGYDG